MKKLIRKRVRKWPEIIGHRFFDPEYGYGFFKVEKVWSAQEYCTHAELPGGSHWFPHYTIQIKTDAGERFRILKLPLDCKNVFAKSYDRKVADRA
nr:MAG TPA: hypothetical protein [Caudoviricetes sp.]